jgi:hypothetical protein
MLSDSYIIPCFSAFSALWSGNDGICYSIAYMGQKLQSSGCFSCRGDKDNVSGFMEIILWVPG